jgi:hypothetical protein
MDLGWSSGNIAGKEMNGKGQEEFLLEKPGQAMS